MVCHRKSSCIDFVALLTKPFFASKYIYSAIFSLPVVPVSCILYMLVFVITFPSLFMTCAQTFATICLESSGIGFYYQRCFLISLLICGSGFLEPFLPSVFQFINFLLIQHSDSRGIISMIVSYILALFLLEYL